MIDHALLYAHLGWPVFPLRGKLPLVAGGNGVLDATTDERRVVEWWRSHPRANIGVRCSAWTVLDVDPRHGGDRTLAAWVAEHGRLPEGPAARTGSGGWHLLFAPLELAEGEERVRHPGGKGAGLDLCSAGHYIVAPPSVHPDTGRAYRWVRRHTLPLPVMPDWLRAECVRSAPSYPALAAPVRGSVDRYAAGALRRACEECRSAPDGAKHTTLAREAWSIGQLVRDGQIDEATVAGQLLEAIVRPGMPASHVAAARKTISQQMRAAPSRRATR